MNETGMRFGEVVAWISALVALAIGAVFKGMSYVGAWLVSPAAIAMPLAQVANTSAGDAAQLGIWGAIATSVGATLLSLVRILVDYLKSKNDAEATKAKLAELAALAESNKVRIDETMHKNTLLVEENATLVRLVAEHIRERGLAKETTGQEVPK